MCFSVSSFVRENNIIFFTALNPSFACNKNIAKVMDLGEDLKKDEENKTAANANHSLGLQDLYKAAFSQEFTEKAVVEEPYSLFSLKQLSYQEQGTDSFNSTAPVLSYEVYSNDANSVLDLDKGVQIQVLKVPTDEFQSYTCDPQILQRYLNDASFIKSEPTDGSNPISESMIYITKPPLYEEDGTTGILPEKVGLKYEDCDFNSSDSFASTESIIPKNIQCPLCPKKFMFKSDLTKHSKHKHANKPRLTCNLCLKEFPSQQNLLFHEKSHKKTTSNVCQICKKSFKKSGFVEKHMMQKHIQCMPFSCPACDTGYPSESLLLTHCRTDHVPAIEKPYRCQTCGKCFEKRLGLTCHMKTHSETQSRACEICQKVFNKATQFRTHMRMHMDPNLHLCEVCNLDCKTASSLMDHQKTHSGDKPFKCEHCPKTFSYKANYTVHSRTHSKEKAHKCEACPKEYFSAADLAKHSKVHNVRDPPLKCTACPQRFHTKKGLNAHVKKMHSKVTTQETFTQTGDDLLALSNVNLVVDQTLSSPQSIVLTSLSGFNSVPFIITQPQGTTVPFSISS